MDTFHLHISENFQLNYFLIYMDMFLIPNICTCQFFFTFFLQKLCLSNSFTDTVLQKIYI